MTASLLLAMAAAAAGQVPHNHAHSHHGHGGAGRIAPPLPGNGAGFPNGNPDGYGWVDYGDLLPLGADRTADYYFRRYWSLPSDQMFLPTYYNPYVSRGQRFIPYSNCGGWHPMGGPATVPATLPVRPYTDAAASGPVVPPPVLNGRSEAPPTPPGRTGLTP